MSKGVKNTFNARLSAVGKILTFISCRIRDGRVDTKGFLRLIWFPPTQRLLGRKHRCQRACLYNWYVLVA